MAPTEKTPLRLALPKGSMEKAVMTLLAEAGIQVRFGPRDYRPQVSLENVTAKILRPQNIVEMLHLGSRDLGFAGADWAAEVNAKVVEMLDTQLDPVRVVAAAPKSVISQGLNSRHLVVASEYQRLSMQWIQKRKLNATFIRTHGATEVYPPEDADCIVDNTATGSTLRANGLEVVDELMSSSTRLYANSDALNDPDKKEIIGRIVLLLGSVLESRRRVMLEVNVPDSCLESVIQVLPCMREPTMSRLHGCSGYAVKAAVPREELPRLIPEIKERGGTDIVVSNLAHIVP